MNMGGGVVSGRAADDGKRTDAGDGQKDSIQEGHVGHGEEFNRGLVKRQLGFGRLHELKPESPGSHVHAGFTPVKFGSLKPGNSPVLSENFSIGVPSRLSIET